MSMLNGLPTVRNTPSDPEAASAGRGSVNSVDMLVEIDSGATYNDEETSCSNLWVGSEGTPAAEDMGLAACLFI